MFTDELRCSVWDQIRQHGLRAFAAFLPREVFVEAGRKAGVQLGKSALWLPSLVMLGLSAAMHRTKCFADVLVFTLKLLEDSEHWRHSPLEAARKSAKRRTEGQNRKKKRSKHDPRGSDPTKVSEEAFVQARNRLPLEFWTALLMVLVGRFQEQHGKWLRWNEFRLLAIDGTAISMQNWKALRDHFGTAKNSNSERAQARMVMLQFPMARIPYRYELTPLAESEARRLPSDYLPDWRATTWS